MMRRVITRQGGVTLIEVLVAMFVMAVGVLGIVGLQVVALQNSRTALYRSEATVLASDIMDRIRANPRGDYAPVDIGDTPPNPPNCLASVCSAAQMANFDLAQWKCSLGAFDEDGACTELGVTGSLPAGDGSVAEANTLFTVRVQWEDPSALCDQDEENPDVCFVELQMLFGELP